jgi:hypothetical protein
MVRSVCEDLIPFVRNSIPAPMGYPSTGVGHLFAQGLIHLFYSSSLGGHLQGLFMVLKYSLVKGQPQAQGQQQQKKETKTHSS